MKTFLQYISEGVQYHEELVGHHSGQSDLKITAQDGSKVLGYIDFSLLNGSPDSPHIQYVFVNPEYRGKGVGKALVLAMAKEYPYTKWNRGTLTNDGSKLMASMDRYFAPFIQRGKDEWGNDLTVPKQKFNYFAHYDQVTDSEILEVAPDYDGWTLHMLSDQFESFTKYVKLRHLNVKLIGNKALLTSKAIITFLKDARDGNFQGIDIDDWNNLNDLARSMFKEMQDPD